MQSIEDRRKRRAANMRRYRAKFPEKHKAWAKTSFDRRKHEIFEHYGNKCSCCGETEFLFLQLDHIDNDGSEHRKAVKSNYIYAWVRKNNFPDTLQLLCANCNWGKQMNKGVCPHKQQLRLVA